ncbi:MAG: DUF3467 domain-containing protein [Mariprofundus sp.]|nr:DUF3467 domain-containing protein [Mariprofundus sp.]
MSDNVENQVDQQQELQIQVPPEVQGGRYANQLFVTHTQEEFILDFILATHPAAVLNSRVLVSPSHAKRIISVLQDNITRYESVYGEIKSITPAGKPDHIIAN